MSDENPLHDPEMHAELREALMALAETDDDALHAVTAAIGAARDGQNLEAVLDAFRGAGKLLAKSDPTNAQKFYGLAELLEWAIEKRAANRCA